MWHGYIFHGFTLKSSSHLIDGQVMLYSLISANITRWSSDIHYNLMNKVLFFCASVCFCGNKYRPMLHVGSSQINRYVKKNFICLLLHRNKMFSIKTAIVVAAALVSTGIVSFRLLVLLEH